MLLTIANAARNGTAHLRRLTLVATAALSATLAMAQGKQSFDVIRNGRPVDICVASNVDPGIYRAATSLANDMEAICGKRPAIVTQIDAERPQIIVGQVGDDMLKAVGFNSRQLRDSTEKHLLMVDPNRIVIAGADKRGAIYGIYALSEMMGVSPWVWWADVPVEKRTDVSVPLGVSTRGCPKVKYRGIFINDEWPSFGSWAINTFGGVNSKLYEKVFELILRLGGNFMWPAMWASAFYDDDPNNGVLANEMGVIMGTSHHEPMALAQQDWKRRGEGPWNYRTNAKNLEAFWRSGIERCKDWETVVTVGMRGDGDEPMENKTDVSFLENIVKRQRKIIEDVTDKRAEKTPQVWALYKEVMDYYEKGMDVPDDITLLLCDDNWGNVRRLPGKDARKRKGGYGMYYHVDYVGDPRNYKWINVTQVERIWEQMSLCYEHGVSELWILNVGDIKPMEYPIQFFLDMAWNPEQYDATNIHDHTVKFCRTQFGERYAEPIADLIRRYTKFNSRRTPEMLDEKTYSLENYNEWANVAQEYHELEVDALRMAYLLPSQYMDAFDQLVLFPIVACANLNEMYYSVARNKQLAQQGSVEANAWADRVKVLFERDSLLSQHYNLEIAGGKWNHMMDQTHIGYTYWQQPDKQVMPAVAYVHNPDEENADAPYLFIEGDGYISINAENASRQSGEWTVVPNLGRTASAITSRSVNSGTWLEYDVEFSSVGKPKVQVVLSPTLNIEGRGHRLAVSVDGGAEVIFDVHGLQGSNMWQGDVMQVNLQTDPASNVGGIDHEQWMKWVGDNAIVVGNQLGEVSKGRHTIRIRPLDNAMVFQKIMVDMGGLKPSYLGAPPTEMRRGQ